MRFFRPRRRDEGHSQPLAPAVARAAPPADAVPSGDWAPSGIGEEVEAFLEGRYVDMLGSEGRPIPVWAALNRLAHTDHKGLVGLVAGAGMPSHPRPNARRHAWAEEERFLAATLLARAGGTPEGLGRLQREALVPVELELISRAAIERMTTHDVLDAGSEALESHTSGA
jgi:hypothetical protein